MLEFCTACRPFRLSLILLVLLALTSRVSQATPPVTPPVEQGVQVFLDNQPGPLKAYRDGDRTAAEIIQSASAYYGISPRILLALLEATNRLLSSPVVPDEAIHRPFGPAGPDGFAPQLDWAARELRAGLGPYDRPPTIRFTDQTSLTLTLQQAPEGIAVQRFLAQGRPQPEWHALVLRFGEVFQQYFHNELPYEQQPQPKAIDGFLRRPWPAGTRVVHLAYFDHMYPTVDTGRKDNGFVVNYLGRGNVQYDGHDGHDFYFPDQPIGTYILAAADGIAYARTHRGNGVVIIHPGGYETVYWHLDKFANIFKDKIDTSQGVQVKAGDLIGSSGMTGFTSGTPHLHFEVRLNGRQIDPYGWYGSGADPCTSYAGCTESTWLWHSELVGEGDFTPPDMPIPDQNPPVATMTINPQPDLLFLARFDGNAVPQVGAGQPTIAGTPSYEPAKFGQGVRLAGNDRLAYPTANNLKLDAGTIAFWAVLPETYPPNSTNRYYLLTASANPAGSPIYTGTLTLRRDLLGPDNTPRWNFWTTPQSGQAGRDDLAVPDTLGAGLHHFALSWDRAARTKVLYLDGALAGVRVGVELPTDVGELLELNRFMPGFGLGGVTIDELAIFGRAMNPTEIERLVKDSSPLRGGTTRVANPNLRIDVNATDDAGAVVRVQLGLNGVFADPVPYDETYQLTLPSFGRHTIAARFYDRADKSTTVSTTVTLALPPQPLVKLEGTNLVSTTLIFSSTITDSVEMQASALPTFSDASWQPLPKRLPWIWPSGAPRAIWLRFRDSEELTSFPMLVGPDAHRISAPHVTR